MIKIVISLFMLLSLTMCTLQKDNNGKQLEDRQLNERVEQLISEMTLEEKVSMCHANGKFTVNGIPRLGIKEMCLSDGPHGVREQVSKDSWKPAGWDNDHATYLPTLTAVASTFNPEMARLHGSVLGAEARHRNKDIILGPGVNLARNPRCGRNFEYMGEDPFLASKIVVPEIIAIQKNNVAACLKHYALNAQELNRKGVDALPSERALRELYLPAFKAAVVEAEVFSVMGAYNSFRGVTCCQNEHLVKDILKGEWNFQGVFLTDWDCPINTKDAALNGLDLEMGTNVKGYNNYYLADPFLNMIKSGEIEESVVDDKVRRILRLQLAIGMMDTVRLAGSRNTEKHHEISKQIIDESVILLKNENILPLNKNKVKKLLVLGPNVDREHGYSGGSSKVKSLFEISPLEGLKAKFGDSIDIEYINVASPDHSYPIRAEYVMTRASGAGVPAWLFKFQNDKGEYIDRIWLSDPIYHSQEFGENAKIKENPSIVKRLMISGTLKAPVSGNYKLMIKSEGKVVVHVNNKKGYTHKSSKGFMASVQNLKADKEYSIKIIHEGSGDVDFGWVVPSENTVSRDYKVAAKEADAVIFFGGLSHGRDREGKDKPDLMLGDGQDKILAELLPLNPNTVVCIIAGSPVEMPWIDKANAVVWGWYGGMFAGSSFADVIFGDINPSGKLPFTLPLSNNDTPSEVLKDYNEIKCEYKEDILMGYRWYQSQGLDVLFPFGHGLSYTTFKYSNYRVEFDLKNKEVVCSFEITNTGNVEGAESTQIYMSDPECSVSRAVRELKGFKKVNLKAGETKQISISIPKKDLEYWSEKQSGWVFEEGAFIFSVGSSCEDIRLKQTITI